MLSYVWMITGAIMFSVRVFLVEIKLTHELQDEKFYLSRLLNYLFWFSMILVFQVNAILIAVLICFPTMLYSFFVLDIPEIIQILHSKKKSVIPKKNYTLVERITLHLPIVIAGIFLIFMKNFHFFHEITALDVVIGGFINYGLFFLLDPRNPFHLLKKTGKKEGWMLLLVNTLTFTLLCYIVLF